MKFEATPHFNQRLQKKLKKQPAVKEKISKQLKLLAHNIKHPSLKVHKLKGKRNQEFSLRVEDDLRITFVIINNTILLTDIITHDEY